VVQHRIGPLEELSNDLPRLDQPDDHFQEKKADEGAATHQREALARF